jgi:hypothetical protein
MQCCENKTIEFEFEFLVEGPMNHVRLRLDHCLVTPRCKYCPKCCHEMDTTKVFFFHSNARKKKKRMPQVPNEKIVSVKVNIL